MTGNCLVTFGSADVYMEKRLSYALPAFFRNNYQATLDHVSILEVTAELY
jgi:hypothetical protein